MGKSSIYDLKGDVSTGHSDNEQTTNTKIPQIDISVLNIFLLKRQGCKKLESSRGLYGVGGEAEGK